MKKLFSSLLSICFLAGLMLSVPGIANATGILITFEELLDSDGTQFDTWDRITNQYSSLGVTFSTTDSLGFAVFNNVLPDWYIPHSPTRIAGTNAQSGNKISFDQPWATVGGWLNVASMYSDPDAYMQVDYWDALDNKLDSDKVYHNYGAETTNFQSSVGNISYITISHSEAIDNYYWAVDDIYTNVPLPGAVWLLGSGLLGLVGFRRKFQG